MMIWIKNCFQFISGYLDLNKPSFEQFKFFHFSGCDQTNETLETGLKLVLFCTTLRFWNDFPRNVRHSGKILVSLQFGYPTKMSVTRVVTCFHKKTIVKRPICPSLISLQPYFCFFNLA